MNTKFIASSIHSYYSKNKIRNEFEQLWHFDDQTIKDTSHQVGINCMHKNKYCNRLPYDYNRVQIDWQKYQNTKKPKNTQKIDGHESESNSYYNASFINFSDNQNENYIAAQGPLSENPYYQTENTSNSFLAMILDQKIDLIISVTNHCDKYYPDTENHNRFFNFIDKKIEVEIYDIKPIDKSKRISINDQVKIEFDILVDDQYQRRVTLLHYKTWPDYGVPEEIFPVKVFLNAINETRRKLGSDRFSEKDSIKTLVHCTAGIGRTGTIICLDHILSQIRGNLDKEIDVFETVKRMRRQRMTMLEAREQYEFVYRFLMDFVRENSVGK